MDNIERFPIIVNADLSGKEKEKLLAVLSKRQKALGYSIRDVKGIHPSIYSHAIPIEEGAKPVIESQRRLHSESKNMVRKEVILLLDAGVIYPISDSKWVSPVHCIPKKRGVSLVTKNNNDLVPTRAVIGYVMFH